MNGTTKIARALGVSQRTVQRYLGQGILKADTCTRGGHRRFALTPAWLAEANEGIAQYRGKCGHHDEPWETMAYRRMDEDLDANNWSDAELLDKYGEWDKEGYFRANYKITLEQFRRERKRAARRKLLPGEEWAEPFASIIKNAKVDADDVEMYLYAGALQLAVEGEAELSWEEARDYRAKIRECLGAKNPVWEMEEMAKRDSSFKRIHPDSRRLNVIKRIRDEWKPGKSRLTPMEFVLGVVVYAIVIGHSEELSPAEQNRAQLYLKKIEENSGGEEFAGLMDTLAYLQGTNSKHYREVMKRLVAIPCQSVDLAAVQGLMALKTRRRIQTDARRVWLELAPRKPVHGLAWRPHVYLMEFNGQLVECFGIEEAPDGERARTFRRLYGGKAGEGLEQFAYSLHGLAIPVPSSGRKNGGRIMMQRDKGDLNGCGSEGEDVDSNGLAPDIDDICSEREFLGG